MKIEYSNTKFSLHIPIEEIKKCTPFFIRALFCQTKIAEKEYGKLVVALEECQRKNGWENFSIKKTYLNDDKIGFIFDKMPFFIRNKVKKILIQRYDVYSYEKNNVFFAGLNLFGKKINKKDVSLIYNRLCKNNQAIALLSFLEEIGKDRPKLLNEGMIHYLEIEQEKCLKGLQ